MKIKEITDLEEKIILKILSPYFNKYSFFYYGSRANGDYRQLSDLDILIKGNMPVPSKMFDKLKQACDESNLPYIVNFTDYHSISDKFYNSIKDDLKKV